MLKERSSDILNVKFLGGEPLLAWGNIKKSYEYLETNKDVTVNSYTILTNGAILNKEIISYLRKNKKIRFIAKIGGYKWAKQLRVFKGNKKSIYDKVIRNLKTLTGYGIETTAHIEIRPHNIVFMSESINHLYKEGIKSLNISMMESTTEVDESFANRYIKEMSSILKIIADNSLPGLNIESFD